MPEQKPTIGRIVEYNTSEDSRNKINGNKSKKLPAIIVAVWSDALVNLKVITDGNNDLWLTSVNLGEGEGCWNWPTRN